MGTTKFTAHIHNGSDRNKITICIPNTPERNHRVFTMEGCKALVEDFKANPRPVPVGVFDKDTMRVRPDTVCGEVTDIDLDERGYVVADFTPIETHFGELAKQLIEQDPHPEFCIIPCFIGERKDSGEYNISSLLGFVIDESKNNAFFQG